MRAYSAGPRQIWVGILKKHDVVIYDPSRQDAADPASVWLWVVDLGYFIRFDRSHARNALVPSQSDVSEAELEELQFADCARDYLDSGNPARPIDGEHLDAEKHRFDYWHEEDAGPDDGAELRRELAADADSFERSTDSGWFYSDDDPD